MKANAQDKIYVQLPSRNWIGRTWNETPIKEGDNPNWKNATNIEYARTDAFIEKAYSFVERKLKDYIIVDIDKKYEGVDGLFFEDFRKYMEGE